MKRMLALILIAALLLSVGGVAYADGKETPFETVLDGGEHGSYYALVDLNGDGCDELLVSKAESRFQDNMFDLFCYDMGTDSLGSFTSKYDYLYYDTDKEALVLTSGGSGARDFIYLTLDFEENIHMLIYSKYLGDGDSPSYFIYEDGEKRDSSEKEFNKVQDSISYLKKLEFTKYDGEKLNPIKNYDKYLFSWTKKHMVYGVDDSSTKTEVFENSRYFLYDIDSDGKNELFYSASMYGMYTLAGYWGWYDDYGFFSDHPLIEGPLPTDDLVIGVMIAEYKGQRQVVTFFSRTEDDVKKMSPDYGGAVEAYTLYNPDGDMYSESLQYSYEYEKDRDGKWVYRCYCNSDEISEEQFKELKNSLKVIKKATYCKKDNDSYSFSSDGNFTSSSSDAPEVNTETGTTLNSGIYIVDYSGKLTPCFGTVKDAVQISCCDTSNVFVLKSDGTVECLKNGSESNYGDDILHEIALLKDIVQISTSEEAFVALNKQGKLTILGNFVTFSDENMDEIRKTVSAWPPLKAFASSNTGIAGISTDGMMYHTRLIDESYNEEAISWPDVKSISVSSITLLGVTESDTVTVFDQYEPKTIPNYRGLGNVVKSDSFGESGADYFLFKDGMVRNTINPDDIYGPSGVIDFDLSASGIIYLTKARQAYISTDGDEELIVDNVCMLSTDSYLGAIMVG